MQENLISDIQERQQLLLQLAKRVIFILAENNIKYFAHYGTLLGAVRHKGFIPWDDDIDLALMRKEYNALQNINWKSYGLEIISPQISKTSPYAFTKIIDPKIQMSENEYTGHGAQGLNLDLFPLDLSDSTGLKFLAVRILSFCLLIKVLTFKDERARGKNLALFFLKLMLAFISAGALSSIIDFLSKQKFYKPIDKIGFLAGPYGQKELLDKSWFSETRKQNFDGLELEIPVGSSEVLRSLYGDYLKLPPVEERISHHDNSLTSPHEN
jgi:lipopolysaccharide cholinephosphotransferase